jgi:hypothetical protein
MAYVVARPQGRFEIRESLHTQDGPRARTLAGFGVLTDEIMARAARRAQRPFDVEAVLASGRRAGAPVAIGASRKTGDWSNTAEASSRFVEASRRMALALQQAPAAGTADPGAALIDLLGFADAVAASQPARPFAPLEFPVLSRLVEGRRGVAAARGSARPRSAASAR